MKHTEFSKYVYLLQEDIGPGRKEKRQYKKRKHKVPTGIGVGTGNALSVSGSVSLTGNGSSGEDEPPQSYGPASPPSSPQVSFPFYRNKNCSYQAVSYFHHFCFK